jgi:hypothetical protein
MKQYLLALLALTSCSKSGPDVDPREQYLGTYNAISSYRYNYGNNVPVVTGKSSGIVTIIKDKEPQKINFSYSGVYTATATLKGSSFELDARTDALGLEITGSGSFSANAFSYTTVSGGPPNDNLFTTEMSGTRQ